MERTELSRVHRLLWVGFFAGPIAWAIDLQGSYMLVPLAQRNGHRMFLFLVPVVTALIAILGGLCAWRGRAILKDGPAHPEVTAGGTWFLANAALACAAMFLVVIVAQAVPVVFVHVYD